MNFLLVLFPTLLFVCTVFCATDPTSLWNQVQNDACIEAPDASYALTDPANCKTTTPACDYDGAKTFCAELKEGGVYACKPWLTACNAALATTTAATTVATTAASAATTVATTNAATTPATTAASATTVSSATTPSASGASGASSEPTPQMSDSAKKWVGKGDSTAVNSKVPVAQKAMKDYLDPVKCCDMAKKNLCDDNKYYMRIACANTCGSVGTDIYNAGAGAKSTLRADCK